MELRHIRYLLAVADHGNFTRAAEALHISQPTLSQQIKQLERLLGVQLLDRSGRTVRPTDAGQVYAEHARNALRDLEAGERAVHDVQDLTRGHLRVAMTPTITAYLVGPLMDRFHRAHPKVTVAVTETTQDRLEEDLLADALDLGIAFSGTHTAGIDCTALFTEDLSLVVGADHALAAHAGPLPIGDLAAQPLALLSRDFATRAYIDETISPTAVSRRASRSKRTRSAPSSNSPAAAHSAPCCPMRSPARTPTCVRSRSSPRCRAARWNYCAAAPPITRPPRAPSPRSPRMRRASSGHRWQQSTRLEPGIGRYNP